MTSKVNASNTVITRLSPAKINLFLHITGKRNDGYHNLQTVFRLLDWGDYLHFLPTETLTIANLSSQNNSLQKQAAVLCTELITLTGASSITNDLADNLIIKAAQASLVQAIERQVLPAQLPKIIITLDKHLPMGAGLGGGSSNAATTLLALNELWELGFDNIQLRSIGATLGADVPIFIFGQDAIATGIGEQLTPIELPNQQYLVLTPNAHINTAQLFAHPELKRDSSPLSIATIKNQANDYVQSLNTPYKNVFSPVVTRLAPAVTAALNYLQSLEAQALSTARMTGSGSAVFLPLDESVVDNKALLEKWVMDAPCPAYVVNNLQI